MDQRTPGRADAPLGRHTGETARPAADPGRQPVALLRRHFLLTAAVGLVLALGALSAARLAVGRAPAAAASGRGAPSAAARPTTVSLATVSRRRFVDRLDAIGAVKARQSVTLTSQTTEIATKIHFTSGQTVVRGQVLAELKTDEQQAAVANAQAALKKASSDNARWQALAARGFAPRAQVEQYEAAYEQAQASLAQAQSRLNDRVIRAPFAGVIGLSDAAPGMLITPGAPIATIDDLGQVFVDFQVPEAALTTVRAGSPVTATADALGARALEGRIAKLDTRLNSDTRSVTARVAFANPGRLLRPGMLLKISILTDARSGLALPDTAVQYSGARASVFRLERRGGQTVVKPAPVTAGAHADGFVEILGGLTDGAQVVADGLNRVRPGQPVRVAAAGAAAR